MKREYPLDWPLAQPRTERPSGFAPAGCRDTITTAAARVEKALTGLGFTDVALSTDVLIHKGQYATVKMACDHGAALAFGFGGRGYHVGQDIWLGPAHNVWSLALMAEGLRQTVRHAGDALFLRMISGFAALPPPVHPGSAVARSILAPHEVLGVAPTAPREVVEAAYRALARSAHPDKGGSAARMAALNAARDAMLRSAPRG